MWYRLRQYETTRCQPENLNGKVMQPMLGIRMFRKAARCTDAWTHLGPQWFHDEWEPLGTSNILRPQLVSVWLPTDYITHQMKRRNLKQNECTLHFPLFYNGSRRSRITEQNYVNWHFILGHINSSPFRDEKYAYFNSGREFLLAASGHRTLASLNPSVLDGAKT